MRLDGRVALVSGGSRGIGFAAAAALAGAGAHVHLLARGREDVAAAAAALGEERATGHAIDVNDRAAVRALVADLPAIDVLVNSAGTNRPKPIGEVSDEDLDVIVDLNVKALFVLSQAVAGRLLKAGRPGSIINVSSQMGHVGAANRSVYCASKHAVEGLTKAMAVELGPRGIRVNSIAPTFILTEMTRPFFEDDAFRASVESKIKLGRVGTLDEITGAVLYLASDASSLVTGTSLVIDGGWTAD